MKKSSAGGCGNTKAVKPIYNAAKYYMNRPDTGEYVEVLELTPTPAQAFAQWTWMQLSTDTIYVIEFDYWGDIAGTEFVFGLYAGYTGVWLDSDSAMCGTGVRHARVELSSSSVDMANAGVFLAYYQDSGSVYITNVRFYNEAAVSDANPFRYCGEYWDSETGTLYLRARYYDPRTGRFTQQDVWEFMDFNDPLSLNLYTYCANNPIFYIDPFGNDFIWLTATESVGLFDNTVHLGHTSALVQNANGEWYYFYWGPDHAMLIKLENFNYGDLPYLIDPMGDIGNFNKWLETVLKPQGYKGTIDYTLATYIEGDFTKSFQFYEGLVDKFGEPNKILSENKGYNVFFNCTAATYIGFSQANIFYNFVLTPGDLLVPNSAALKMAFIFGNASNTSLKKPDKRK